MDSIIAAAITSTGIVLVEITRALYGNRIESLESAYSKLQTELAKANQRINMLRRSLQRSNQLKQLWKKRYEYLKCRS
ncbi:MAG: hypothetical protein AAGG02_01080 [Cyanobacteria bacterium P01_H01_bin.15]